MYHHSTRNTKRLTTIIAAWTNLSPTKSFAGMTLAEFKRAISPSLEARSRLARANERAAAARVDRDNADRQTMRILDRVVAAVVADEIEGNDGVLYAAMGYVRKSDRRSGLTRRPAAPTEAIAVKSAKATTAKRSVTAGEAEVRPQGIEIGRFHAALGPEQFTIGPVFPRRGGHALGVVGEEGQVATPVVTGVLPTARGGRVAIMVAGDVGEVASSGE